MEVFTCDMCGREYLTYWVEKPFGARECSAVCECCRNELCEQESKDAEMEEMKNG